MSDANFQDESVGGELSREGEFNYNDRYGVRPERAWVPYALSFLLIGGGWILWAGLHHAEPEIAYSLVAFDNSNPRNTEIRYTVTRRDPSALATCIVAARDIDKVIVGQITDHIPATQGPVERTVTIPSRADAVNAGITTCYLD